MLLGFLGRAVAAGVPDCGLWSTVGARDRTTTMSRALILSYPPYSTLDYNRAIFPYMKAEVVEWDEG